MLRDKENSEYSRLPLYNKGLKLLTQVLESDRVNLKGNDTDRCALPVYNSAT